MVSVCRWNVDFVDDGVFAFWAFEKIQLATGLLEGYVHFFTDLELFSPHGIFLSCLSNKIVRNNLLERVGNFLID